MANLNRVFLIGNLTRDPDLRVTPKGTAVCQFGLAVNRQFKNESGQVEDETTFVDVEAWGRQGETIAKYVTKGRPLFVEGRLRLDSWDDKATGQKRSKLKIVLENFQFLGSGRSDSASSTAQPPPEGSGGKSAVPTPAPREQLDEDVPF